MVKLRTLLDVTVWMQYQEREKIVKNNCDLPIAFQNYRVSKQRMMVPFFACYVWRFIQINCFTLWSAVNFDNFKTYSYNIIFSSLEKGPSAAI